MMQVWILEAGEDHEGGRIVGVYGYRDAAYSDFAAQATSLHERFCTGLDTVEQEPNGSLYLHSGCDWLSLTPYDVINAPRLPAAESEPGQAALPG